MWTLDHRFCLVAKTMHAHYSAGRGPFGWTMQRQLVAGERLCLEYMTSGWTWDVSKIKTIARMQFGAIA